MLKVIIRVDASLEMGIGHVMRCLSIAEELKKNGNIVEFICRNHDGNLIEDIISKGFIVRELEKSSLDQFDNKLSHAKWLGTTQKLDAQESKKILIKSSSDWLIIDHYGIDEDWENEVKKYTNKIIVLDDLADRKHNCSFLIDQTFARKADSYRQLVPPYCELLLGSNYALLRPEFNYWREFSLQRRAFVNLKNILITMGGNDLRNYSVKIIEKLNDCSLSNETKVIVIMGSHSQHIDDVLTIAKTASYNVEVKINVTNMAEIMANADLAIGASGSSTWERCCLGLPSIQISVAKNQEISSNVLASKNIIKLIKSIDELPNLIDTFESWHHDFSRASLKICDGLGTTRVINKILGSD